MLIHGAGGGVGSIAVQIAKVLGAGLVIATAGTEEKRALARRLGADVAVDYNAPDWPSSPAAYVRPRGGRHTRVDRGGVFEQNVACLAPFGRYAAGSTWIRNRLIPSIRIMRAPPFREAHVFVPRPSGSPTMRHRCVPRDGRGLPLPARWRRRPGRRRVPTMENR